jgi:hypothetical protein
LPTHAPATSASAPVAPVPEEPEQQQQQPSYPKKSQGKDLTNPFSKLQQETVPVVAPTVAPSVPVVQVQDTDNTGFVRQYFNNIKVQEQQVVQQTGIQSSSPRAATPKEPTPRAPTPREPTPREIAAPQTQPLPIPSFSSSTNLTAQIGSEPVDGLLSTTFAITPPSTTQPVVSRNLGGIINPTAPNPLATSTTSLPVASPKTSAPAEVASPQPTPSKSLFMFGIAPAQEAQPSPSKPSWFNEIGAPSGASVTAPTNPPNNNLDVFAQANGGNPFKPNFGFGNKRKDRWKVGP